MADPKLLDVIASAAKSGRFGENYTLTEFVPSNVEGEDHFASQVVFGEVKLKSDCGNKTTNVIVKREQKDAFVREMMETEAQFYNEALMYNDILPFIEKNNIVENIFPKLIYGKATLGENYEDDILIVDDLRQYGYTLTKEKLFLDFDHCALALKKLGQFHALSYAMKQENSEQFLDKISKLKEVRGEQKDDTNRFLLVSIERGVLPVLEEGEHTAELERFMEKVQDPFKTMKELCQPEEPLAVLCHGDFCRNNMVFLYESERPVDVKFFDVATSRYASPVIDLSFFFFMNTSADLRRDRWDDLLKAYHEGLSSAIPGCRVPSLDVLRLEFKRKAVYGYVLCSFFIPMMLDHNKTEMEDFVTKTPEEIEEISKTKGGEVATKYISDVIRHLLKLNSL